jgi:hypothetical protein
MAMGPDNVFHGLSKELAEEMTKPRYDKEGLTVFNVGEHIEIRNYIFVVNKIDNLSKPNRLILVPVGPVKNADQVEALNRLEDLAKKLG